MVWIAPIIVSLLSLSSRKGFCFNRAAVRHGGGPCWKNHEQHDTTRQDWPVLSSLDTKNSKSKTSTSSTSCCYRRDLLLQAAAVVTAWSTLAWPCRAADDEEPPGTVRVTLSSPADKLGLELYSTNLGDRPIVAIRRSSNNSATLQPGMILQRYDTMEALKAKLQAGPYPITLTFNNLAAGGDAIADDGKPLVTAQDALELAQKTTSSSSTQPQVASNGNRADDNFQIQVLNDPKPTCPVTSRRNDVLEINYVATYMIKDQAVVYDASENRGTGQPYQMVLGSGDMLPGVDLGLYDACPGEARRLTIPPRLAYGVKGNRLFGIPPQATLVWHVQLVRINGMEIGDERTRDEMEQRVPYSSR